MEMGGRAGGEGGASPTRSPTPSAAAPVPLLGKANSQCAKFVEGGSHPRARFPRASRRRRLLCTRGVERRSPAAATWTRLRSSSSPPAQAGRSPGAPRLSPLPPSPPGRGGVQCSKAKMRQPARPRGPQWRDLLAKAGAAGALPSLAGDSALQEAKGSKLSPAPERNSFRSAARRPRASSRPASSRALRATSSVSPFLSPHNDPTG